MSLYSNRLRDITSPGELDRPVTILARTDTPDVLGQLIPTWSTLAADIGLWVPTVGAEKQTGTAYWSTLEGTLRLRYRSDVTSAHRIQIGSIVFEILQPPTEIGRQRFIDLRLRAITTSAP